MILVLMVGKLMRKVMSDGRLIDELINWKLFSLQIFLGTLRAAEFGKLW